MSYQTSSKIEKIIRYKLQLQSWEFSLKGWDTTLGITHTQIPKEIKRVADKQTSAALANEIHSYANVQCPK